MEKEIEKNTVVLQEDDSIGVVKIADDVVAMIAALAAVEVEGVASLAGSPAGELMSKVGMKNVAKGVKVDVMEDHVTVGLTMTLDFGCNIQAVCQKVQGKVKSAIENMTGLCCMDVNIRVVGVSMKKDK